MSKKNFKINANLKGAQNLEDIKRIVEDQFRQVENWLSGENGTAQDGKDGKDGKNGKDGKDGEDGTGGGGAELIVADGVDNPPEFCYTDDGGDYIYADG